MMQTRCCGDFKNEVEQIAVTGKRQHKQLGNPAHEHEADKNVLVLRKVMQNRNICC